MPGLNTSLLTAMHALMAQQGAMNATTSNIANANTPGYSRKVPVLIEATPVQESSLLYGSGVSLEKFQSIRDELLDLRIQEETAEGGRAEAQAQAASELQPLFASSGQDIGSLLSAFFNSISQLTTDPANPSLRQGMLSAGQNLATSFHITVSRITQIQAGLNDRVVQDVGHINQLANEIAGLNTQLISLQTAGQDGGTIKDQQTELIRQLSQLTDVSVIQTERGITLTTGNGTALVVGNQVFALETSTGSGGQQQVISQGSNITGTLKGGSLGGNLQMRDQALPGLLDQLDILASTFANSFNAAHQAGMDLSGNPGTDFFSVPSTVTGAASQLAVAITDPAAIAASSDGSVGSNGNLSRLLALQSDPLSSGQSPRQTYSNIVFHVGTIAALASAQANASNTSLQQLNNQRSALSGVSIDEESVNLLRYQRAFEAAARVITTIDQLTQVALNMGVSGGGY